MAKSKAKKVQVTEVEALDKTDNEKPSLLKSILNVLNGNENIERLAFESDPTLVNRYGSLYRAKLRLLPDTIIKRISIQDSLVAAIVNTRGNHLSVMGRERPDRFSMGFVIRPHAGIMDNASPKQKEILQDRIDKISKKLVTCGEVRGWSKEDRITFSQFLKMCTRDAVTVGRIAMEVIWLNDPATGKRRAHSFRPIDAGTIYKAAPQQTAAEEVRKQAHALLQQIKNEKLIPEKFENDKYAYVQVIDGKPLQAFTDEECVVHNFYPVTHVELDGYPLTPLDTVISAVTTHINITTHNRLYFQSGRATRGMLVIKSDEMDEGVVSRIRQQFNASINSVNNAWRMPVFGVGQEDNIVWSAIDQGQRDMEFQYLSDNNTRVILSAFQMSPEELPGFAYLSRGTNSQSLSESNGEYKLEAARDVGIRPLVKQWEDFINVHILPILDPELSKLVYLQLLGLDAETAEKESVRLQQDQPLHMTYDEILEKVEKDPVGKRWGGGFSLNPSFQAILDMHSGLTVGKIAGHFLGRPELRDRPDLQYVRDPFWFQWQQLSMQKQQMQMQQEQMAAQAAQPPQQPPPDGQPGGGQLSQDEAEAQPGAQGDDLTSSINQAIGLLSKSEKNLPISKRKVLAQHRAAVNHFMNGWNEDVQATIDSIMDAVNPKPKKKSKAKSKKGS